MISDNNIDFNKVGLQIFACNSGMRHQYILFSSVKKGSYFCLIPDKKSNKHSPTIRLLINKYFPKVEFTATDIASPNLQEISVLIKQSKHKLIYIDNFNFLTSYDGNNSISYNEAILALNILAKSLNKTIFLVYYFSSSFEKKRNKKSILKDLIKEKINIGYTDKAYIVYYERYYYPNSDFDRITLTDLKENSELFF